MSNKTELTIKEHTEEKEFKGYSLEELRYQRALVALQREFCQTRMMHKVDQLRNRRMFGGEGTGKGKSIARVSGIAGKLFSGLNYLDYAMIGMSAFSSARKFYTRFLKKKRK